MVAAAAAAAVAVGRASADRKCSFLAAAPAVLSAAAAVDWRTQGNSKGSSSGG